MAENSWSAFVELCESQYTKLQEELKEIDMLIQQTSSEVDRLVQKNARAAASVRQVDAQFETVPREDMKNSYHALVESQQRLFTMRGQLEKLQSDQKNKTRLAELYDEVLKRVAPKSKGSGGNGAEAEGASQEMVVVNVIEAQERERQRLSRQMHDGPAQSLTNLVLQAEICERLFDRDPDRAREELAELKENVVSTFQKVKGFIFTLRPMMLDDLGLVPTLKRYAEGLEESGFAGISLSISGKERRLAAHKEVTIFRVIQELHHIAWEYGNATNIKVSLDIDEDQVRVSVEDDGSGFELGSDLSSSEAKRLGLPTLRERIGMLDGTIHFDSAPAQGMRVSFTLPVISDTQEGS